MGLPYFYKSYFPSVQLHSVANFTCEHTMWVLFCHVNLRERFEGFLLNVSYVDMLHITHVGFLRQQSDFTMKLYFVLFISILLFCVFSLKSDSGHDDRNNIPKYK